MSALNICARCLRANRKVFSLEQLTKPGTQIQVSRQVSYTSTQRQRAQPQQNEANIPPPIPTTTPTITSNLTAPPPPDHTQDASPVANYPSQGSAPQSQPKTSPSRSSTNPAADALNAASPAQMQRTISATLSKPPPTSTMSKLARTLRATAKSTTETYITYGYTEMLFKSCSAQAPYTVPEEQRKGVYTGVGPPKNAQQEDVGIPDLPANKPVNENFWFSTLQLEPTFSTWSQVTFLHMYILTTKLRTLESNQLYLDYQRYLLEHFSNAAEDKMALLHGMSARGTRNKYLKDLFVQWRGVLYAYDQGMVQGDAVLAGAVWRNIWKAEEDVDWEKVAMVVSFVRRCVAALEGVSVREMATGLRDGNDTFWEGAREGLIRGVERQSLGISQPIDSIS